jgi:hypothetical protein
MIIIMVVVSTVMTMEVLAPVEGGEGTIATTIMISWVVVVLVVLVVLVTVPRPRMGCHVVVEVEKEAVLTVLLDQLVRDRELLGLVIPDLRIIEVVKEVETVIEPIEIKVFEGSQG